MKEALESFIQLLDTISVQYRLSDLPKTHLTDYSQLPEQIPAVICFPTTAEAVQKILIKANHLKIPITTRGLGTGKSGGAIPTPQGILMSLEKMDQIIEIDPTNRTAKVEPGVILKDLKEAALAEDLFYPPDPSSLDICSIGGNVAENAGGSRCLKYGVTREYVLGLKGFWGDASAFNLGGKLHKNVAGYDLISLLVGSEGTLGIVTEITLKLIPKPQYSEMILWTFDSYSAAIEAMLAVSTAGIQPSIAELFDHFCMQAIQEKETISVAIAKEKVYLLIEIEAASRSGLSDQVASLKLLSKALKVKACYVYQNEEDQAELWKIRRGMSEALTQKAIRKMSEDTVVPLSELGNFLNFLEALSSPEIHVLGYGHAGDGNIHVNLLQIKNNVDWELEKQKLLEKIFKKVIELGGTVTGEHGIGLAKKEYLPWLIDDSNIKKMKALKAVFDPNVILNPDKIFKSI